MVEPLSQILMQNLALKSQATPPNSCHTVLPKNISTLKKPWPVWLSWLEHHSVTEMLRVRFLVRAHTWFQVQSLFWAPVPVNPRPTHTIPSLGTSPGLGTCGRQPIDASLLHQCFSPFLSL